MGSLAIARLAIIENLRRKEFYVVLVMVVGLAVWMMMLNMSTSGTGRFAKDIVMQVVWLASFGLAVPLAARQIANDLEQKTIYVIMCRPIHRCIPPAGKAGSGYSSMTRNGTRATCRSLAKGPGCRPSSPPNSGPGWSGPRNTRC